MTGHLWYRLDLPDDSWRDPYLFVHGLMHYEVYLDWTKILERNMDQPYSRHVLPPSNLGRAALIATLTGLNVTVPGPDCLVQVTVTAFGGFG